MSNNSDLDRSLCLAAARGDLELCADLLERSADANARHASSEPVLSLAAYDGHAEICSLLLRRGADIQGVTTTGLSALDSAAISGKVDVCRVLIGAGAVRAPHAWRATKALLHAAEGGHVDACRVLLDSGADVHGRGIDSALILPRGGQSAIECAAAKGSVGVCTLLVERGATISGRSVTSAASAGHCDVVRLLLSHVKLPLSVYRRVFEDAVANGYSEMASLLMGRGVRPGVSDLILAGRKGHINVCEVLVKHGAAVNGRESTGRTPLHAMAGAGALEAAQFLLEHGADVNIETDRPGWTPLYQAIDTLSSNAPAMCRLLIAHGADTMPACENSGELTPFQFAVASGNAAIVRCLAEVCDEDPSQRTVDGTTMLELAGDWVEVAQVLRALITERSVSVEVAADESGVDEPRRLSSGPCPI
jgi:ankyrin repeat protein